MADRGLFGRFINVGLPEVDKLLQANLPDALIPNSRRRTVPPPSKDKYTKEEDVLSKLPDYILRCIISLLSTRECAATCILSRRWRNLWKVSITRLDFTDLNVFGFKYPKDIFKIKNREFPKIQFQLKVKQLIQGRKNNVRRPMRPVQRKGYLEIQRDTFIRRVNQILQQLPSASSRIDKFMVSFPMGEESASHLDIWMKLAAAQGVRKLQLDFNWYYHCSCYDGGMSYKFPLQEFGSSLNNLSLRCCIIEFPRLRGLSSLVSLSLMENLLTEDNVQTILSSCPRLEFLSLKECIAAYPITLRFIGPSLFLKHLDIYCCHNFNEIQLQDVNLLSFELQMLKSKVSIKNAPCLARLAVYLRYGSVETLSNVPRLETLLLTHKVALLPNLSAFGNLRQLVFSLDCDSSNLFEVLCFLEACPLLQQLHVNMGVHAGAWASKSDGELTEESRKIIMRPRRPHENLKEIEMYDFHGHPRQIKLAKYLLRDAVVLEKMKIYITRKTYNVQGKWTLSKRPTKPMQMSLSIRDLLLKEKHASTQLWIASKRL